MRRTLFNLIIIILMGFISISKAADTYTLDPNHTYVLWHANHFGFSNPSGKWYASGNLVLDEEKPQNSRVNVTIQMATLDTGNKDLDDHLKGELFFDVAKFKTATFVSNKVDVLGENSAKVSGILTLHGIAKPLILNVKLNKIGPNIITNKNTAGFSATTHLKRSDFGINTLLPGVGDDIEIQIEAEAFKA